MSVLERAGAESVPPGPALDVRAASKTFGAHRVLSDVDLQVAPGEIRALVGENGSGKSTLVKILAGYHRPDGDTRVVVGGVGVAPLDPAASDAAGLRFVHQDLALVPTLSTVENLGLGRGFGARPGRAVRWRERRREAETALASLGYDVDVMLPVAQLEASERTAVAVARAVSAHHSTPKVLVLDEPTANLPGPEVERLFRLVRRVSDTGLAVLFISHHLTEVFDLAGSVTVLRSGELVTTRAVDGLTEDGLIELMVGRRVDRVTGAGSPGRSETVVRMSGVAGRTVRGIDLTIARGEIVGVAGITGSGREALAPLVFGAASREGEVVVAGHRIAPGRPDLSVAAGIALVPADRARNAVLHGHDVGENLTIVSPGEFVRRGVLSRRLESRAVVRCLEDLDIRPPRPRLALSNLSGGNAQKVVLARWLRTEPAVLLLDEPTQGVDVGSREQIHQRIEATAAEGCAVLVCSTDSEELSRLCHRVVVLVRGEVQAELFAPFHPDDVTAASLSDTRGTPS